MKEKAQGFSIVTILVIIGVIVVGLIGTFNGMLDKRVKVEETLANVDVQLTRRTELIPNLVNTVKGFTAHENEVFNAVTEAREHMMTASTVEEKAIASEEVSDSLNKLIAVAEAYPELKSDTVYVGLMDELAGTENRIAIAREEYNKAVAKYNTRIRIFPANVFASMMGFEQAELFRASDKARESVVVEF